MTDGKESTEAPRAEENGKAEAVVSGEKATGALPWFERMLARQCRGDPIALGLLKSVCDAAEHGEEVSRLRLSYLITVHPDEVDRIASLGKNDREKGRIRRKRVAAEIDRQVRELDEPVRAAEEALKKRVADGDEEARRVLGIVGRYYETILSADTDGKENGRGRRFRLFLRRLLAMKLTGKRFLARCRGGNLEVARAVAAMIDAVEREFRPRYWRDAPGVRGTSDARDPPELPPDDAVEALIDLVASPAAPSSGGAANSDAEAGDPAELPPPDDHDAEEASADAEATRTAVLRILHACYLGVCARGSPESFAVFLEDCLDLGWKGPELVARWKSPRVSEDADELCLFVHASHVRKTLDVRIGYFARWVFENRLNFAERVSEEDSVDGVRGELAGVLRDRVFEGCFPMPGLVENALEIVLEVLLGHEDIAVVAIQQCAEAVLRYWDAESPAAEILRLHHGEAIVEVAKLLDEAAPAKKTEAGNESTAEEGEEATAEAKAKATEDAEKQRAEEPTTEPSKDPEDPYLSNVWTCEHPPVSFRCFRDVLAERRRVLGKKDGDALMDRLMALAIAYALLATPEERSQLVLSSNLVTRVRSFLDKKHKELKIAAQRAEAAREAGSGAADESVERGESGEGETTKPPVPTTAE